MSNTKTPVTDKSAALPGEIDRPCWPAALSLQLRADRIGTRITDARHHGPLYVQKPFYPEGPECAHIYVLHPPGGIVSGDTLTIDIELRDSARAVVTSPGACRFIGRVLIAGMKSLWHNA